MHAAQVRPAVFNSIKPCKEGLKDRLNVMICIPDSKEEAMKEAVTNRSEATVFLYGLGYEGAIGMAAVLYRGSVEKKTTKEFMGSEDRHMVFKAELLGLSLQWN